MKMRIFVMVMGCLFLVSVSAQAQPSRSDRFFPPRGEPGVRPEDLRVVELGLFPDPVRQGQRVLFRIAIVNSSRRSATTNLILKDRDEVISEARDVLIQPGENRVAFPETFYRFERNDHCFTVEVDIEHTWRPIDLAQQFCARQTPNGWTLRQPPVGPLYVEDMDLYPDPVVPGQDVQFKVRLRNGGRQIRAHIQIQDRDQVVAHVENVLIPRGVSEFQFPPTRYPFQRFDHCFTVLVDFERTPYPVDAARQFCAKPVGWSLRP